MRVAEAGRMRQVIGLLAIVAVLISAQVVASAPAAAETLQINVLSNRADLVSGGDALVELMMPEGENPGDIQVHVGGRDVTSAFALRPNGRFMGLVTSLAEGENVLTATLGRQQSKITISNHPIGGPVFSGPQVQPWICSTEQAGLGPAQDEQCNAPTKVEYFYKSTNPVLHEAGFQPYDPKSPPSDVARTTTEEGEEVPFIVRREVGTINRAIYDFAVLYDPQDNAEPWSPPQAWNQKLYYQFWGGFGPNHIQSVPNSTLDNNEYPLSRGWVVATSSKNVLGKNANPITSAEVVLMLKERIIEAFGDLKYTVGAGCSGGSVQVNVIAEAYPGLLDGIIPACTYTDWQVAATVFTDCPLLARYFNETSPHLWAIEAQRSAVDGHQNHGYCSLAREPVVSDRILYGPEYACTLYFPDYAERVGLEQEPAWVYHPTRNPSGARCTIQDYTVAVVGRRPAEAWSGVERRAGLGFANRTYDNTGVQYGLRALESGLISAEQFVDLNEKVGSWDIDKEWQPSRSVADPGGIEAVYRSGLATHGRQLGNIPIIDIPSYNELELHPGYMSRSIRARLDAVNGHHDNHVIWARLSSCGAQCSAPVEDRVQDAALDVMSDWLSAIAADDSNRTAQEKVVRNKPAAAVDACWIGNQKVTDQNKCRQLAPYFGNPRIAAGGPVADDIVKCQLKPLDRSDYNVIFTDDQWTRLQQAFPTGVCDYSKPGVSQQPSTPWLTYENGPGGEPLGPALISCTQRRGARGAPAQGCAETQ